MAYEPFVYQFIYRLKAPIFGKDEEATILRASIRAPDAEKEVERILAEVHRLNLQDAVDKLMTELDGQEGS